MKKTKINPKKIVKIVDILGKEIKDKNYSVLFYIYDDGTVKKVLNQQQFLVNYTNIIIIKYSN